MSTLIMIRSSYRHASEGALTFYHALTGCLMSSPVGRWWELAIETSKSASLRESVVLSGMEPLQWLRTIPLHDKFRRSLGKAVLS